MLTNNSYCSQIQIVLPMLYRQTASTWIWLLMLLIDIISVNISLITLFMMHLTVKQFVVLRPKCYASLCTGKVDKNVVQHTRPVERKIAKGGKCKVKDDQLQFNHYLDALRNFQTLVCKQNLISSAAHTVRTVHNQKVGLTAFDTKTLAV